MNKKKLITISIFCLAIIISSIVFFELFYKTSGNNEKGKLYLELLPATSGYEATIKNQKDKKVVSKKLEYFHGNMKENPNGTEYGKWEIKSYKFKYEITEQEMGYYILKTSYYTLKLHLYVDVISDELGLINFEITNPVTTIEKGKEYTFRVNRTLKDGFKFDWDVYNYNDEYPEVLKVNHNTETGSILSSKNEATITALEYGRAYIRLRLYKGDNQVVFKDYRITVPYLAKKMELIDDSVDGNIIYHGFRHCLKIKYQPVYSTNEKVTITFSNPILKADYFLEDLNEIWLEPLGVGNVTVTVTTDNGVSATKEYVVKKR